MNNTRGMLRGRTALVTGAGSGIGRGIAQSLAAAGASVVLAVRRRETGEETLALIDREGGEAIVVVADATSLPQMQAAAALAVATYGGLDIAVHNANSPASAMPIALEAVTDADWDGQASVAHHGAFLCAKVSHAELKRSGRGRFILLASSFGLHGAGFNPIYAALKGGDRGFVTALAREWGGDRITVNAICPAAATPPAEIFFAQHPAIRDQFLANFALGRMGSPREDIGEAVAMMCSDGFGYVTGQTIVIDGGLYTAV